MNTLLTPPAPAGQPFLLPVELHLHNLISTVNRKRQTIELKKGSLLRQNIREDEVNFLNADIRELNGEIEELEKEAEKVKALIGE